MGDVSGAKPSAALCAECPVPESAARPIIRLAWVDSGRSAGSPATAAQGGFLPIRFRAGCTEIGHSVPQFM